MHPLIDLQRRVPEYAPFNTTIVDDYRAYSEVKTLATRARIWDIDTPKSQNEVLDDVMLRKKLDSGYFDWVALKSGTDTEKPPRLSIITTVGEPSTSQRALQIQKDTLFYVMKVAGICERSSTDFFTTAIPTIYSTMQYDDADMPTHITIFFRCPKNSNCVTGIVKVRLATRACFAFLSARYEDDVHDILDRCVGNVDLLRNHPLQFLPIVFDNRFRRWTDWFAHLWGQVVELETVTNMTHPIWKTSNVDPERRRLLSHPEFLLNQLHSTHLELCHSHTIMSFAERYGRICLGAINEMEEKREELGYAPLSRRHVTKLQESLKFTLTRCDSMSERLKELSGRLSGQINVSYSLIAQKDSKVNLTIAKLQVHDSQTVKGIAILTLLFLPSTLVATLWTTNLWTLEGNTNWQVYSGTSILLTVLVLVCWWGYGRAARARWEARWPTHTLGKGLIDPI